MKTLIIGIEMVSILTLVGSAHANVTMNNNVVGAATSFQTYSISGVNGTLAFQSILPSPAGATIQGGASQGAVPVGTAWGEVFNWTGGGLTLSAIAIIDNGGGGVGTYQPFLFDLGTSLFNAPSSVFDPSNHVSLLSATTLAPPAFGSANFLEFDFSGADAITLTTGHSYAFGLLNNNATSDMTYRRSNGVQSDPNGDGFTFTSFSATGDNAAPYSSAVRNSFIGVYTIPEPSPLALLGLSTVLGAFVLHRKNGQTRTANVE
jgi:hypothetical protein